MKTYDDLSAARAALDNGGWLLDVSGAYLVTDDVYTIIDLRGQDFIDHCEEMQCWDETILPEQKDK